MTDHSRNSPDSYIPANIVESVAAKLDSAAFTTSKARGLTKWQIGVSACGSIASIGHATLLIALLVVGIISLMLHSKLDQLAYGFRYKANGLRMQLWPMTVCEGAHIPLAMDTMSLGLFSDYVLAEVLNVDGTYGTARVITVMAKPIVLNRAAGVMTISTSSIVRFYWEADKPETLPCLVFSSDARTRSIRS